MNDALAKEFDIAVGDLRAYVNDGSLQIFTPNGEDYVSLDSEETRQFMLWLTSAVPNEAIAAEIERLRKALYNIAWGRIRDPMAFALQVLGDATGD